MRSGLIAVTGVILFVSVTEACHRYMPSQNGKLYEVVPPNHSPSRPHPPPHRPQLRPPPRKTPRPQLRPPPRKTPRPQLRPPPRLPTRPKLSTTHLTYSTEKFKKRLTTPQPHKLTKQANKQAPPSPQLSAELADKNLRSGPINKPKLNGDSSPSPFGDCIILY